MKTLIRIAIRKSLKELDEAYKIYIRRDNIDVAALKIWNASLEIEYAMFILRFILKIEKSNAPNKYMSINPDIKDAIDKSCDLLRTADKFIEKGNLSLALNEIYIARKYLIDLQEKLEKNT